MEQMELSLSAKINVPAIKRDIMTTYAAICKLCFMIFFANVDARKCRPNRSLNELGNCVGELEVDDVPTPALRATPPMEGNWKPATGPPGRGFETGGETASPLHRRGGADRRRGGSNYSNSL
jgi:hypothetical protein